MEYNERKIGGTPVIAIAQLVLEAVKVLFTPGAATVNIQLYEDSNIKLIAEKKHINVEVAISIAAGQAAADTGNKTPSNDEILAAAASLAEMPDDDLGRLVDSTKGKLAERGIKPDVPLTQQKSLIQNMAAQTGEFKQVQEAGQNVFVKAVGFSWRWPVDAVKLALGYKSEEDQIEYDKKKFASLGYKPEQVNQALRLKAMNPKITDAQIIQSMRRRTPRRIGQGEISGLQIAKLVLLVLVIIIIFAGAYTGSKMMLGFLPFLLIGLGGVALYDYLKTETPPKP